LAGLEPLPFTGLGLLERRVEDLLDFPAGRRVWSGVPCRDGANADPEAVCVLVVRESEGRLEVRPELAGPDVDGRPRTVAFRRSCLVRVAEDGGFEPPRA